MRRVDLLVPLVVCGWLVGGSAASAQAQPETAAPAPAGVAQRISLDLKGMDILDVLKIFSQQSGLNFIAGKNVSGKVTIFLKDVDVWDAFAIVMAANELAYERTGSIVNVMTAREYELLYGERFNDKKHTEIAKLQYAKALPVATVLNQVKSNIGRIIVDEGSNTVILMDLPEKLEELKRIIRQIDVPVETRIVGLRYAQADKLKEKLQEVLTPGVGTFQFDERTNKVVITDLAERMEELVRIVTAWDEQTHQVLIEAKVVQVTLTDTTQAGIDWKAVFGGISGEGRVRFDDLGDILAGTGTGGVFKVDKLETKSFSAAVKYLETIGTTNVLSTPRVAVTDGEEAKILVGKKQPFVTTTTTVPGGGSPNTTAEQVTFVDVGVNLTVTPSIKSDGFVSMKIKPEISSLDTPIKSAAGNEFPVVKSTTAETNVLVKHGTTIIIAGLIEDKITDDHQAVPGMNRLPFVGALFRNRKDVTAKTETAIFLTPYIIRGDEDIREWKPMGAVDQEILQREMARAAPAVQPVTDVISEEGLPMSYRQAIRERLSAALQPQWAAVETVKGETQLSFVVTADGFLLGEPQAAAPNEAMRAAVQQAVRQAAPFPPFPKEIPWSEARFRVTVEHDP